jgi:orotate phosphoribosyltransferase-like protein
LSRKAGIPSKAEQLEWRRAKVVEMKAKGMTQQDIARELQVSDTAIGADVQYLRQQAKDTIKEYSTDHLPAQYQLCLVAFDSIIKRASDMIDEASDNRERLQAMQNVSI